MSLINNAKKAFKKSNDSAIENYHQNRIKNLIQNHIYDSRVVDRDKRISPSQACNYCPRQAFFAGIKAYKRNWQAHSELYARFGNIAEDFLADGLNAQGYLLGQGVRLWENDDLKLGAYLDLLVDFSNEVLIVEVKTCGKLPTKPRKYQLWQLYLYMSYYVCDGYLHYISRDIADYYGDLKQISFPAKITKKVAMDSIINSYISAKSLEMELIPPRNEIIKPPTPSDKKYGKAPKDCGFCSFADKCWYGIKSDYKHMPDKTYKRIKRDANNYAKYFFNDSNILKRRKDLYEKLILPPYSFEDFNKRFQHWNAIDDS